MARAIKVRRWMANMNIPAKRLYEKACSLGSGNTAIMELGLHLLMGQAP
jgi:hypothetical protein